MRHDQIIHHVNSKQVLLDLLARRATQQPSADQKLDHAQAAYLRMQLAAQIRRFPPK